MSGAATSIAPNILGHPSTAVKRREVRRSRKARRLAMLPNDIRNLITITLQKKRLPIQADDLYEPVQKKETILEIHLGGKKYQVKTPLISNQFLTEYKAMTIVMEKFGEHALISHFLEEDVQEAMRGIMKYFMFVSSHTFTEEDLKINLIKFEEMETLMLLYIDEPNVFGHQIYYYWDNIIYFFKVGFVAEDNIRLTTSKNKAERIKKDWSMLIGYKSLKDEFIIAVDAAEFQKILELISKGGMRSLKFKQNKPYNIPSNLEGSIGPKRTLRKVRTRNPPSPPDGDSGDDSEDD